MDTTKGPKDIMTLYRSATLCALALLSGIFAGCAGPSELIKTVPNPHGPAIEVWSMGSDAACHDGAAGCWKGANKVFVARFDEGAEAHEVNFHGINGGQHTEPWQPIEVNGVKVPCAKVTFPGYNSDYKFGDVMCRFDLGEPRKARDARERIITEAARAAIKL